VIGIGRIAEALEIEELFDFRGGDLPRSGMDRTGVFVYQPGAPTIRNSHIKRLDLPCDAVSGG
jgi:hypothetical protein